MNPPKKIPLPVRLVYILIISAILLTLLIAGCRPAEHRITSSDTRLVPGKTKKKDHKNYRPEINAEESPAPTIADGSSLQRNRMSTKIQPGQPELNTEAYDRIYENDYKSVKDYSLSTFSVDVDTASYSNMRRYLNQGSLPPRDAVRIEELVNYFSYDYQGPDGNVPFATRIELGECPWNKNNRLVHIGIKGKNVSNENTPPRNLVFLLDVSGSMNSSDKLPLLKKAMKMLVNQLGDKDHVSIVVYAGASGLLLPPVSGDNQKKIIESFSRLNAGGSTNGGQGIKLAYQTARKHFRKDGINRVILATDGDFNVGITNQGDLTRLIEKERESGVFLTVLGFGMGNLKDSTMEKLADKGNGNYAYIDNVAEARKVLVEQMGSTLNTIAKDVKIQVEFSPKHVKAYRLIGYENRMLKAEDFNNDKKDAGEIGAGHTVTAIYEVIPAGSKWTGDSIDPLKYQNTNTLSQAASNGEVLTLKIRYKAPDGTKSKLLTSVLHRANDVGSKTSDDFRFSAAVASFGMMLRDSKHKGQSSYAMVKKLAKGAYANDVHGYRAEFVRLVNIAESTN